MKIEVKAPAKVEEGTHTGVIVEIEYRTNPYEYTDVIIETKNENGDDIRLRYGCPTHITKDSKLGRILEIFGKKIKVGEQIDPADILQGKKCQFMTMDKKTEKGTFSRIVEGSVKPVE